MASLLSALMARDEIPQSGILISRLVRDHREGVLAGTRPGTLAAPPQAYVEVLPPVEPTEVLFALRSIKWKDGNGKQRSTAQFNDAELPTRLVKRALSCGACVPVSDPRRRANRTQGGVVRLDTATDLDAPVAEPEHHTAVEPVMHSAFEPPTIGPARVLKIAR